MELIRRLFYKNEHITLQVTSGNGFHLRPIARFVNEVKALDASVTLIKDGQKADAKSINAILALGLEHGDFFILEAKGRDPRGALSKLSDFFAVLMQDDFIEEKTVALKFQDIIYQSPGMSREVIAQGIAIAPLVSYAQKIVPIGHKKALKDAIATAIGELNHLYQVHKNDANAAIYLAQIGLLEDISQIAGGKDDISTYLSAIKQSIANLQGGAFEARRLDYMDIQKRVLAHMGEAAEFKSPTTPFILLSDDLLPSEIQALSKQNIKGVVLKKGSMASHTAILLRSFGIPALIADVQITDGTPCILDALQGFLIPDPQPADILIAQNRAEKYRRSINKAHQKRFEKTITPSGGLIKILANISDLKSALEAKEQGSDGVGLLRSEFMFRETEPTAEEQTKAYREIFELFEDVTVRTLDVGGDKSLPYIQIHDEANPFLGIRGVRLFRSHPHIMETQLQAIFQAADGRAVKIMFPMVSSPQEFIYAKNFAQAVATRYGLDIRKVSFGIMIEVPAVIFEMEAFNQIVDFYSIGTNDLTQYLFAIERTHPTLHADPLSPALFDALNILYQKSAKPISICGEIAAEKEAVGKLLEIGFSILSIAPSHIPTIKEIIRNG